MADGENPDQFRKHDNTSQEEAENDEADFTDDESANNDPVEVFFDDQSRTYELEDMLHDYPARLGPAEMYGQVADEISSIMTRSAFGGQNIVEYLFRHKFVEGVIMKILGIQRFVRLQIELDSPQEERLAALLISDSSNSADSGVSSVNSPPLVEGIGFQHLFETIPGTSSGASPGTSSGTKPGSSSHTDPSSSSEVSVNAVDALDGLIVKMLDLPPQAVASSSSISIPGSISATEPEVSSAAVTRSSSAVVPGISSDAVPESGSSSASGSSFSAVPGSSSSAVPGSNPAALPGSTCAPVPGSSSKAISICHAKARAGSISGTIAQAPEVPSQDGTSRIPRGRQETRGEQTSQQRPRSRSEVSTKEISKSPPHRTRLLSETVQPANSLTYIGEDDEWVNYRLRINYPENAYNQFSFVLSLAKKSTEQVTAPSQSDRSSEQSTTVPEEPLSQGGSPETVEAVEKESLPIEVIDLTGSDSDADQEVSCRAESNVLTSPSLTIDLQPNRAARRNENIPEMQDQGRSARSSSRSPIRQDQSNDSSRAVPISPIMQERSSIIRSASRSPIRQDQSSDTREGPVSPNRQDQSSVIRSSSRNPIGQDQSSNTREVPISPARQEQSSVIRRAISASPPKTEQSGLIRSNSRSPIRQDQSSDTSRAIPISEHRQEQGSILRNILASPPKGLQSSLISPISARPRAQEQGIFKSPISTSPRTHEQSRFKSPISTSPRAQDQWRFKSPIPISPRAQEQSRFKSPIPTSPRAQEQSRFRSPIPTSSRAQEQSRFRSPIPSTTRAQEQSRFRRRSFTDQDIPVRPIERSQTLTDLASLLRDSPINLSRSECSRSVPDLSQWSLSKHALALMLTTVRLPEPNQPDVRQARSPKRQSSENEDKETEEHRKHLRAGEGSTPSTHSTQQETPIHIPSSTVPSPVCETAPKMGHAAMSETPAREIPPRKESPLRKVSPKSREIRPRWKTPPKRRTPPRTGPSPRRGTSPRRMTPPRAETPPRREISVIVESLQTRDFPTILESPQSVELSPTMETSSIKENSPTMETSSVKENPPTMETSSVREISSTMETSSVKENSPTMETSSVREISSTMETSSIKEKSPTMETSSGEVSPSMETSPRENTPTMETSSTETSPTIETSSITKISPTMETLSITELPPTIESSRVEDSSQIEPLPKSKTPPICSIMSPPKRRKLFRDPCAPDCAGGTNPELEATILKRAVSIELRVRPEERDRKSPRVASREGGPKESRMGSDDDGQMKPPMVSEEGGPSESPVESKEGGQMEPPMESEEGSLRNTPVGSQKEMQSKSPLGSEKVVQSKSSLGSKEGGPKKLTMRSELVGHRELSMGLGEGSQRERSLGSGERVPRETHGSSEEVGSDEERIRDSPKKVQVGGPREPPITTKLGQKSLKCLPIKKRSSYQTVSHFCIKDLTIESTQSSDQRRGPLPDSQADNLLQLDFQTGILSDSDYDLRSGRLSSTDSHLVKLAAESSQYAHKGENKRLDNQQEKNIRQSSQQEISSASEVEIERRKSTKFRTEQDNARSPSPTHLSLQHIPPIDCQLDIPSEFCPSSGHPQSQTLVGNPPSSSTQRIEAMDNWMTTIAGSLLRNESRSGPSSSCPSSPPAHFVSLSQSDPPPGNLLQFQNISKSNHLYSSSTESNVPSDHSAVSNLTSVDTSPSEPLPSSSTESDAPPDLSSGTTLPPFSTLRLAHSDSSTSLPPFSTVCPASPSRCLTTSNIASSIAHGSHSPTSLSSTDYEPLSLLQPNVTLDSSIKHGSISRSLNKESCPTERDISSLISSRRRPTPDFSLPPPSHFHDSLTEPNSPSDLSAEPSLPSISTLKSYTLPGSSTGTDTPSRHSLPSISTLKYYSPPGSSTESNATSDLITVQSRSFIGTSISHTLRGSSTEYSSPLGHPAGTTLPPFSTLRPAPPPSTESNAHPNLPPVTCVSSFCRFSPLSPSHSTSNKGMEHDFPLVSSLSSDFNLLEPTVTPDFSIGHGLHSYNSMRSRLIPVTPIRISHSSVSVPPPSNPTIPNIFEDLDIEHSLLSFGTSLSEQLPGSLTESNAPPDHSVEPSLSFTGSFSCDRLSDSSVESEAPPDLPTELTLSFIGPSIPDPLPGCSIESNTPPDHHVAPSLSSSGNFSSYPFPGTTTKSNIPQATAIGSSLPPIDTSLSDHLSSSPTESNDPPDHFVVPSAPSIGTYLVYQSAHQDENEYNPQEKNIRQSSQQTIPPSSEVEIKKCKSTELTEQDNARSAFSTHSTLQHLSPSTDFSEHTASPLDVQSKFRPSGQPKHRSTSDAPSDSPPVTTLPSFSTLRRGTFTDSSTNLPPFSTFRSASPSHSLTTSNTGYSISHDSPPCTSLTSEGNRPLSLVLPKVTPDSPVSHSLSLHKKPCPTEIDITSLISSRLSHTPCCPPPPTGNVSSTGHLTFSKSQPDLSRWRLSKNDSPSGNALKVGPPPGSISKVGPPSVRPFKTGPTTGSSLKAGPTSGSPLKPTPPSGSQSEILSRSEIASKSIIPSKSQLESGSSSLSSSKSSHPLSIPSKPLPPFRSTSKNRSPTDRKSQVGPPLFKQPQSGPPPRKYSRSGSFRDNSVQYGPPQSDSSRVDIIPNISIELCPPTDVSAQSGPPPDNSFRLDITPQISIQQLSPSDVLTQSGRRRTPFRTRSLPPRRACSPLDLFTRCSTSIHNLVPNEPPASSISQQVNLRGNMSRSGHLPSTKSRSGSPSGS